LEETFGLRGDTYKLLPDMEPKRNQTLNNGKWLVQVGSPFLPEEAKNKVIEALGKANSFFIYNCFQILALLV